MVWKDNRMSFFALIEPALAALGLAPDALQIANAETLAGCHYPALGVDRPALIGPLRDAAQCQELSHLLRTAYPADHPVTVIGGLEGSLCSRQGDSPNRGFGGSSVYRHSRRVRANAFANSPEVQALSLDRLAHFVPGAGASLLYLPPLPHVGTVETFQDTVARLRAPDGCPWDRQQTHRSLRQAFQEEAYEVLDALDQGDPEKLKEELGDVLLSVLMQVQIANEMDEFRLSDVVRDVHAKIVRRHPHVFGDLAVGGVDEVLVNWEAIKRREKGAARDTSVLDTVSRAMPALARAQSIQRRVEPAWSAGAQELAGLGARLQDQLSLLLQVADPAGREAYLGRMLFDLADWARRMGIDAEGALREANAHFEERFRAWEREHRSAS
jgi:tetrapyrrole methylase family protein/MazG family protein